MKISVDELKKMVSEAVSKKLAGGNYSGKKQINEGPEEISIRMILSDLKEPVVGSIVEELSRETKRDEAMIESVVSSAFDVMTRQIVQGIERMAPAQTAQAPRRRVVAGLGGGGGGVR